MPRIRSVHPGLWTDLGFVELSMAARLLAIGLWTESDDFGVFKWSPRQIKMRIFPADALEVEPLLAELVEQRLIIRINRDGVAYGIVRNFRRFQRPNRPSKPTLVIDDEIATLIGIPDADRPPIPPNGGAGKPYSVSPPGALTENAEHGRKEGSRSESSSNRRRDDSDSDGKVAIGPWKRPATLPDDDSARLKAVHQVETFFAEAPADRDRILAHLGNTRLVPDPRAYAETCIANAVRARRKRKPKVEPLEPAPALRPDVFVEQGSDAWNAWAATRKRSFPTTQEEGSNRVGWYFTSEFPAQQARA